MIGLARGSVEGHAGYPLLAPCRSRRNQRTSRGSRCRTRPASLILIALLLTACSVTLIAPYDEQTDVMLTNLARSCDDFFDIAARTQPTYEQARVAHETIRGDLRVLVLRNQARDRNELTLAQLDALGKIWDGVEDLHKDGPLSPAVIETSRGIVARAFRATMRLEIEKRRLR